MELKSIMTRNIAILRNIANLCLKILFKKDKFARYFAKKSTKLQDVFQNGENCKNSYKGRQHFFCKN